MNTTDQAFIAAFKQSLSTGTTPHSAVPASGATNQRIDLPHSRHRAAASAAETKQPGKAPLSEHLARRRAETTDVQAANDQPLRPGVEVGDFTWPALVEELVTKARQPLLDLLASVTKRLESNDTPAISLVGTRPGVGATTTLLAITKLVASVGGRVAVIDASGAGGAASCLGVRRSAHLDSRVEPTAIDDLLVSSRGCGTSVLAIAAGGSEAIAAVAVKRLVATHDLVMIDAGNSTAWLAAAGADRSGVLVVDDDSSSGTEARYATAARIEETGIDATGFVETYAPAG